jgi:hypothetical protein
MGHQDFVVRGYWAEALNGTVRKLSGKVIEPP